ncbi:MAG: response regulator transcription factor [Flavobacteriaceae bacterium]|jgi:DNA-binding NarL/FixJ family response regulator|nr:response regulator transcription factor [Flavobacteriaceae bacterium]
MIKIISIDDHRLFFEGLKAIIEKEGDLSIINGFDKSIDVIEVAEGNPDILLLDVHLPGKSGIQLAKEFKSKYPHIKIILLSMEVDFSYIHELEDLGVEAYISKEIETEQLLETIRSVYSGKVFHPSTPSLPTSNVLSESFNLTKREIEIYEFIKKGFTNPQIAEQLNLSIWTVKTHRKNIKQKLNIKDGFKIPIQFRDED